MGKIEMSLPELEIHYRGWCGENSIARWTRSSTCHITRIKVEYLKEQEIIVLGMMGEAGDGFFHTIDDEGDLVTWGETVWEEDN
ncbi:hypothetical protein LP026_083 [Listeria phage LP-026]|uniref:Uncharacterized protein n=1 Tax=Listeria phage LP-026 TaxID=1173745 RepID=A0A059TAR0_9CAUD|nr:hypothetical protein LP026_083 [Listeria phage LP-026]AHN84777.1 hypothetical protein LP026_083 [Listeria phage LP-026]